MYQTGIPACDVLKEMTFTGNIIPHNWYRVFVKRGLKHPKPHLLAINLLADIVYWYRPAEVRDGKTGALLGYRKKFAGDMLQRSYAQIATQFGCSAGQARDAVVFLEEMGVVRRELRTIEAKGMTYSNILYLALDADKLRELTCPSAGASPEGGVNSDTPASEYQERGMGIPAEGLPEFHQYTENTIQEISTENPTDQTDSPETFVKALRKAGRIPANVARDKQKMRMLIHWLCEYDHFQHNAPERTELGDEEHRNALTLFADCLCSMICARGAQTYAGETVQPHDVLDALTQAAPDLLCGELTELALSAVDAFCDAMESSDIRNVKGYMKSVIWNSFAELGVHRGKL